MEKFNEHVLPFFESGYIRYLADGVVKSMSVEYFQNNFSKIAGTELPHIGHRYYYYQSNENPELVMRFRISQNVGLSASIILYSEFENQFSIIANL